LNVSNELENKERLPIYTSELFFIVFVNYIKKENLDRINDALNSNAKLQTFGPLGDF